MFLNMVYNFLSKQRLALSFCRSRFLDRLDRNFLFKFVGSSRNLMVLRTSVCRAPGVTWILFDTTRTLGAAGREAPRTRSIGARVT